MKKYKVTVNGTAYEIELEVIDAADVKAAPAAAAAPAPAAPGYAPAPGYQAPAYGGYSAPAPGGYSAPSSDFAMLDDDDAQLPF